MPDWYVSEFLPYYIYFVDPCFICIKCEGTRLGWGFVFGLLVAVDIKHKETQNSIMTPTFIFASVYILGKYNNVK